MAGPGIRHFLPDLAMGPVLPIAPLGPEPRSRRRLGRPGGQSAWGRPFVLALLVAILVSPASSQEPPVPAAEAVKEAPPEAAFLCPFCRASISGSEFCPRCGRLSRIATPSSGPRFWADIP